ncbi:hypothetical protein JCM33374_g1941 [Metschnikowia sp. JCM 33374]|nr:hypothetical protein JCM33374_g1941 [Metschnikowia sp. JCM 33374]
MSDDLTGLLGRKHTATRRHHLSTAAVSMLAVGGTIGTGLFFSVATLLAHGPLMAMASMCYVAFLVVIVLEVTAELSVFLPGEASLCKFLFTFLGRPVGLANSLIYWLSWGLTYALELSIAISICSFWDAELASRYQTSLILICWATLTAFNLFPVDIYGQIECWMAFVKVAAIFSWILVIFASLLTKDQFFYAWVQDWPTSTFGPSASWTNHVVAFINCLIFSSFIFQSVESIAITTGDINEPETTIPKATKIIFVRIVVFYLASVFLLTISVPYSDPALLNPDIDNPLSSPFLIAMVNVGFPSTGPLLSSFNFVILSAIISAANSNVYFGSRFLESMVQAHGASSRWKFLARKNSYNVPVNAVLLTSALGLASLLLKFQSIATLFSFLLTCCASAGMLMWLLLCLSHVRFSQALKSQGKTRQSLKYCSNWKLEYWAWFASVNLSLALLMNGLTNYWDFSWLALMGSYMTPLTFAILWLWFGGCKDFKSNFGLVPLSTIDLSEGNFKPS